MNRSIRTFLGVMLIATSTAFATTPPIPTKDSIAPLSMEGPMLTRCIQEGIPLDLPIPKEERWPYYTILPDVLVALNYLPAAPVLAERLISDLPSQIQQDLEIYEAQNIRITEEERHTETVYDFVAFQAQCAEALGHLGDPSATPQLKQFLERMAGELKKPNCLVSCTMAFRMASVSLAALGDSSAVDIALGLMACQTCDPEEPAWALRIITGQLFGPYPDSPPHVRWEELPKWQHWWTENQMAFQPSRDAIISRNGRHYLDWFSDRDTLRYNLRALANRYMDMTDDPALTYLEANGPKQVDAIAAIMHDVDEGYNTRQEAMRWYARFGGQEALQQLTQYVKGTAPCDPADTTFYQRHYCPKAFEIINENDPKLAYSLAVWNLESEGHIPPSWAFDVIEKQKPAKALSLAKKLFMSKDPSLSATSVGILMRNGPKNIKRVAEKMPELAPYAQRAAVDGVTAPDDPNTVSILAEAVKSTEFSTALSAVEAIRKLGIASSLPQPSQQIFKRLDADPRFKP